MVDWCHAADRLKRVALVAWATPNGREAWLEAVTQRLKQPGAQWDVTGAVQTAKARAAWLSGEWPALRAQRAALPLAA